MNDKTRGHCNSAVLLFYGGGVNICTFSCSFLTIKSHSITPPTFSAWNFTARYFCTIQIYSNSVLSKQSFAKWHLPLNITNEKKNYNEVKKSNMKIMLKLTSSKTSRMIALVEISTPFSPLVWCIVWSLHRNDSRDVTRNNHKAAQGLHVLVYNICCYAVTRSSSLSPFFQNVPLHSSFFLGSFNSRSSIFICICTLLLTSTNKTYMLFWTNRLPDTYSHNQTG